MIENDSFWRKTCCMLVSRKAKPCPQGVTNLNRDAEMWTIAHEWCLTYTN